MIKVFKTFELTDSVWKQIIDGFNESFGRNKSVEGMKQYYCCNVLGYSYHAIDFTNDGIVRGYNSIVPTREPPTPLSSHPSGLTPTTRSFQTFWTSQRPSSPNTLS